MKKTHYPDINPWIDLWVRPRATIRYLIDTDPYRLVIWLAIFGGILTGLTSLTAIWTAYPSFHTRSPVTAPILAAAIGALIGVINLYFGSWLYRLTGSWLGGKGTFTNVKCAVGWSNYPFIFGAIFNLLNYFSVNHFWLQFIFGLLNLVLVVWGIIIFLKVIAEAHEFSFWRSFCAFLIASVLLFVVFMIIGLIIPLIQPLWVS